MTSHQGRDAVIVGAVRTPIGKGKASGALHDVLPADPECALDALSGPAMRRVAAARRLLAALRET